MNFGTTNNLKSEPSEFLPPILPTSKLLQDKRAQSANSRQHFQTDETSRFQHSSIRRNSVTQLQKTSLPPMNNSFDSDTYTLNRDTTFPRGDSTSYSQLKAEEDMKVLNAYDKHAKGSVYNPDYISSSKPRFFTEEDSDDNTWVRVSGFRPSSVSAVLTELSKCGYIQNNKDSIYNYMYLQFSTQIEAERALGWSNRSIQGDIIMVQRCAREEVFKTEESLLNRNQTKHMEQRDNSIHQNEIYKRAPVKRISICSMLSEWIFGV